MLTIIILLLTVIVQVFCIPLMVQIVAGALGFPLTLWTCVIVWNLFAVIVSLLKS